jgi:hypothetical protein
MALPNSLNCEARRSPGKRGAIHLPTYSITRDSSIVQLVVKRGSITNQRSALKLTVDQPRW